MALQGYYVEQQTEAVNGRLQQLHGRPCGSEKPFIACIWSNESESWAYLLLVLVNCQTAWQCCCTLTYGMLTCPRLMHIPNPSQLMEERKRKTVMQERV